jgi:hypothetical protein
MSIRRADHDSHASNTTSAILTAATVATIAKDVTGQLIGFIKNIDIPAPVQGAISNKLEDIHSKTSLAKNILLYISPIFLAFGWLNFFKAVKAFWQAKNKNYERLIDLLVSFVNAAGLTIVFAFLVAGVAGLIYAAPYVLIAILGLNALRGIYYVIKSIIQAINSKTSQERWQHIKEAGWHLLGIITSSLGIALNVLLLSSEFIIEVAQKGFSISVSFTINHLKPMIAIATAWVAAIMLNFLSAAAKINQETWNTCAGRKNKKTTFEQEAIQDVKSIINIIISGKEPFAKRFFLAVSSPITLPIYAITCFIHVTVVRAAAALIIGIPQSICQAIYSGIKYLFTPTQSTQKIVNISESLERRKAQLKANYQELNDKIINKIGQLKENKEELDSHKRQGKIIFLEKVLHEKMGVPDDNGGQRNLSDPIVGFKLDKSIDTIEESVFQQGYTNIYQSFFKPVGEVEKISNEVRTLENEVRTLEKEIRESQNIGA